MTAAAAKVLGKAKIMNSLPNFITVCFNSVPNIQNLLLNAFDRNQK
jgi:hypothetical protein